MKKYRFLSMFLMIALLLPTTAMALEDPAPACTAALVVDATYDEVLYEMNAHEKRYPASITKIMTALLTLEAVERGELNLNDMITAPPGIHNGLPADGSTQNIKSGEELSLLDLLYCALVASANESCNVLAYAVAGDTEVFIEMMNQRAAELGMTGTHFVNTHGIHDDDHYTTTLHLGIGKTCCTQPLGTRHLEELHIVRVMHNTHLIGMVILYAYFCLKTLHSNPHLTYSIERTDKKFILKNSTTSQICK